MTPIEAVSVCVGYGDFLREVAPYNRPLLDRWVVVTSPRDEETREVCRACSIECVLTEEHGRDGPFSKGRMIDRGLATLGLFGWVLHIDADIALPADLHQVLDDAHLDEQNLYGADRLNVSGEAAWDRVRARGLWARPIPWACDIGRKDTTPGRRIVNHTHGYTPIGYFQLWHGQGEAWRHRPTTGYPRRHGTAARTDVQHALMWDRRRRVLIPELVVWHVSKGGHMGANWAGRTTPRFRTGPPCPPKPCPGY